jgi:perosamine synthetase
VCELHAEDERLIGMFAKWRDENQFAFPTRFPVTLDGTRRWLRERLLDVPQRMLFLVLDRHGYPVGHLGLVANHQDDGTLEIDNVVRGVPQKQLGLMSAAMQTMIDWAEEQLLATRIDLRVLDDNPHAIEFYRKLGFIDDARIPLRKTASGESVKFQSVAAGDPQAPDAHFLVMIYQPQRSPGGSEMILTAGPSVSARECSYVADAARNGWNGQWNKYLKRFEDEFADRCNVKFAMATSSCTGAMHLALLALGIGAGDEVIVPDLTWVATASAVCYVGAIPVFADVDPESLCMDPASFEQLITPQTKAVMPVHLYGHPARMDRITHIARQHNLFVIEDAAPSIGAEFLGRPTGSFGDFACFSFQGAKLLVTGEGGMLLTDNEELFQRARKIADHGRSPGTFWIDQLGHKYKMSNLQAAFGLGQLQRTDELVAAKRRILGWYAEGLEPVTDLTLLRETADCRSAYWMTNVLVNDGAPLTRNQLSAELQRRKIDTRPIFPAISQYPIWPRRQQPQPVAQWAGTRGINLHSGVCLRKDQVEYVCATIRELLPNRQPAIESYEYICIGPEHTQ